MLACGQPIAYVISLFGPPALSRTHDGDLTESVFYTPHALVQLLSDEAIGTRRLSITVTDERFALRVRDLTFDQTDVRLGKSKFWNLTHDETGHVVDVGAGRLNYVEGHYFGEPGADQSYLFAFNDVGVGEFDDAALRGVGLTSLRDGIFADEPAPVDVQGADRLRSFRSATTINTLTVVEAAAAPALIRLLPHGIDRDYVRVFRPAVPGRRRAAKSGD